MAKRKRNIGKEILQGIRDIKRGMYGRVTYVPSISSIRERTGLSQARFAQLLGVSVRTLKEWERGRRAPSGAARTLLLIAASNPEALRKVGKVIARIVPEEDRRAVAQKRLKALRGKARILGHIMAPSGEAWDAAKIPPKIGVGAPQGRTRKIRAPTPAVKSAPVPDFVLERA